MAARILPAMDIQTITAARITHIVAMCFVAVVGGGRSATAELAFSHQGADDYPSRVGGWSRQRVTVSNAGDVPEEGAFVTYATAAPYRQYGRVVSVPPHARRRISYPVRIPESIADDKGALEIQTQMLGGAASSDSNAAPRRADAQHATETRDGRLILDRDRQTTAIVTDDPQAELLARTARVMAGLSSNLYRLRDDWTMSPSVEVLRAFDSIVIASNRLLEDPQGALVVRRWMQGGGRLWLMADRTSVATIEALLGDDWSGIALDRTTLVQLQLRDERPVAGLRHGVEQELVEPVALVQMHPGEGVVDYTVSEWPAAIRYQVGRGALLITTLGPRGWYGELTTKLLEGVADRRVARQVVRKSARMPLSVVARQFLQSYPPPPIDPDQLRAAASQRVGYRAPSRLFVSAVLGTLCGMLLLFGFFLHRRQRSSWNALLGPGAAALTAVVIAAVGRANRTAIPPTFASADLLTILPSTHEFQRQTGVALFHPEAVRQTIEGRGAVCDLEFAGQEGQVQRIVWTDVEQWRRPHAVIPPGLSPGQQVADGFLPGAFRAEATLDGNGLSGRLNLPANVASRQGVVATGWGPALAAVIQANGAFNAGPGNELAAGRYSNAPLLNDEALRREGMMREFFSLAGQGASISGPTLFVWTDPWPAEHSLETTARRVGESLVVAPLALTRPAADSIVSVPAALIPFEAVAGPDGSAPTSAYSNVDRKWVDDLSRQARISLRFQLPACVLPARVESAKLEAEIHAPDRTVQFLGWRETTATILAQDASPVRRKFSVTIDQPELLADDPDGGIVLTINVGPHPKEGASGLAATGWRIANVYLTAKAAVDGE